MDESPVAQLLRHAQAAQRARQAVAEVTRKDASQAEAKRPGGQAAMGSNADDNQG